jgi:hypothetical protein
MALRRIASLRLSPVVVVRVRFFECMQKLDFPAHLQQAKRKPQHAYKTIKV